MNRSDEEMNCKSNIKKSDKPYVVIVTGGIATGKSEVSKYLKELGYSVLDSDKIVHDGYTKGSELYSNLIALFSHDILDEFKNIDRQKLGRIVFSDNEKLSLLNNLVHHYVRKVLINGVESSSENIVFLDIPLFFEAKESIEQSGLRYDEIWLVYVNEEIQKDRLKQRAILENKDPEQALSIINKQMSIEKKRLLSNKVINNEGSIAELRKQVDSLLVDINCIIN